MRHAIRHVCHEGLLALFQHGKQWPTDRTIKQHFNCGERRPSHGQ
jgi:hypothetical protein